MLKNLIIGIVFVFRIFLCLGQDNHVNIFGKVSFMTSNNVYVKFTDTKNISIGDTLFLLRDKVLYPALVVKNKSSTSCVTNLINGHDVMIDDPIAFKDDVSMATENKQVVTEPTHRTATPVTTNRRNDGIAGSISAATYSNIATDRDDSHRTMYRLSLTAQHINQSKFSLETYLNYRQTFIRNDSLLIHQKDMFNIYNLALRYDLSPTASLSVGRKINSKISSVGAIDGLQGEKYFGNFYTGFIAGFRPDIANYTFNSKLFEYGGYLGIKSDKANLYSQTTIGFLEQQNDGQIDRRYTYFQHSSTLFRKINLFSSVELDLYSQVNGVPANDLRMTNLYVSLGYRISKMIDFNVAYDSRKQILYYETFKTDIERLLDNDDARQGLRFRVNFRPYKTINLGINYSQRFQSTGLNQSENMNGYLNLSRVPGLGGRLFINVNKNTSDYLESQILSFRHSRTLIKMKLDMEIYYRMVTYQYLNKELAYEQQYYGASLSYQITRKMALSVLGELATLPTEDNYRINTRITKRF